MFVGMIPLKGLHFFDAPPRTTSKLAAKDSPNNISSLLVTPDIKVRSYCWRMRIWLDLN